MIIHENTWHTYDFEVVFFVGDGISTLVIGMETSSKHEDMDIVPDCCYAMGFYGDNLKSYWYRCFYRLNIFFIDSATYFFGKDINFIFRSNIGMRAILNHKLDTNECRFDIPLS